jgi:SAM-dependent methyltransferase
MDELVTDARCRSCGGESLRAFLSLGKLPLPDALLRADQLDLPEPRFPLDVAFCENCTLVQLLGHVDADVMFVDNYLYFSSFSDAVMTHSRRHALGLVRSRKLGTDSLVVELASNDGYLLRNFVEVGVPVLGIDPAPDQAAAAEAAGVPTIAEFFGRSLAWKLVAQGRRADVIIANNVMAHVPDLDDFVGGMAVLLADDGLITVENPWVGDLVAHAEFDTIYHEHVCYYSCTSVDNLVAQHGLHLNHVEYFPNLHGGTLRWHISRDPARSAEAQRWLDLEADRGLTDFAHYEHFGERVEGLREELQALLRGLKADGASIAAYGAAAKGTVMLNYVGIDDTLVDFVVDRNPHKHGLYMPGVHLPIVGPEALVEQRPDYTLLLAWNFTDEIVAQQAAYREAGGRFIRPVPRPEVLG